MKRGLDFQSIIFKLQTYWASQGCLIWQPYYSQVGAGTMNPATFLRVLGPEPWRVAYVEPSVRPDDGRYGINPNRLQQHYQFQVILKPDPGNPQELYLNSLLALGIDPRQHDIRFVEDNWESPALSAWGLGWEVWLDGQEITQFTYFQQAGGKVLEVPSVEITYGLERIAMTLQRVSHFKDLRWNESRLYGDVNQVAEREHSTYYYEVASVARLREMFNLFTQEAENALEHGLVLPAYDNVIKCSHTFNVLDARGAVGFTERQALFGKMRELSRKVAEAYYAQREVMGFPWIQKIETPNQETSNVLPEPLQEKADFLFEIGTEELPAGDLDRAIDQLQAAFTSWLAETRLEHGQLIVQGTPRRLAIWINDLQTRQANRVVEVKGPPADRAFDNEGKPTKVAEGFARSRSLDVAKLGVKDFDNGRYVVVQVEEEGKSAVELLQKTLHEVIRGMKFGKSMRWNNSGDSFSRPVRWLLATLGNQVVPFSFGGLQSDNLTYGLRFAEEPKKKIESLDEYQQYLKNQGIILDQKTRSNNIWQQALALAESVNGALENDDELLQEITNLVESPTALLASFDDRYLKSLPHEVLIGVMKKHQRYIPVLDKDKNLTNHFIVVRNGDSENAEIVVDGNQQVVLARFADAEFFVREDMEKKLEDFVPKLAQLTFQKELGSMFDKTERIEQLTRLLAKQLDLTQQETEVANRIAHLSKADLATAMVVEMTALQGVMGKYYARHSGESDEVSDGVFEYYLPRTAEDLLPQSKAATVVGLADRLDSIAGLFAVGLAPTGNKDPFALRRAAIGLVILLAGKQIDFDIRWALKEAGKLQKVTFSDEAAEQAAGFITGRLHNLLIDEGYRYDVVDAIEAIHGTNPGRAKQMVKVLNDWVNQPFWTELLPAFSRSVRMTRDLEQTYVVDAGVLVEKEELELLKAVERAEAELLQNPGIGQALEQIRQLVDLINTFFDKVLVMADEQALRESRLGILQRIAALMKLYADFSKLEGF